MSLFEGFTLATLTRKSNVGQDFSPLALQESMVLLTQAITPEVIRAEQSGNKDKADKLRAITVQLANLAQNLVIVLQAGITNFDQEAINTIANRFFALRKQSKNLGVDAPEGPIPKKDEPSSLLRIGVIGGLVVGGIWAGANLLSAGGGLIGKYRMPRRAFTAEAKAKAELAKAKALGARTPRKGFVRRQVGKVF